MNILAKPGWVLVEPILRQEDLKSDYLETPPPEYQGVPSKGKVYAVADDITDVKKDDVVVFRNDPAPEGFRFGDLKLMALPIDSIAGIVKEP